MKGINIGKKALIIGVVSLVLLSAVAVFFMFFFNTQPEGLPEDAVKEFCGHMFAAFPIEKPDAASAASAKGMLSGPAKNDIKEADKKYRFDSVLDSLVYFSGIANVPEGGVAVDVTVQSEDAAMVKVSFSYSAGLVSKAFYMKLEGSKWKIDSVKDWPAM